MRSDGGVLHAGADVSASGRPHSNEALLPTAGAAEAAGGRLPPAAFFMNRRSRAPRR